MYQWDEPKRGNRPGSRSDIDNDLLDPLLEPATASLWLDPSAVGRVEGRLRGNAHPPRSAEEMAETLRRLGDLSPCELNGPMDAFLVELERDGRARSIVLHGTAEPERWVSAEEAELYASAFSTGGQGVTDEPTAALETIVRRHLQTHALVGLDDLTARYPIGPALATELLERWADDGTLVRLEPLDADDDPRWAVGRNLAEVRRLSIALRRKETVAVSPEVFADVLVRRQGLHPETRRSGKSALVLVLEQLQGFAALADLWESEIFPARVSDYRPAWLDEILATGDWHWRAEAEGRGDPRVAFLPRGFRVDRPTAGPPSPLSEPAERVLSVLSNLGASFTTDLVRGSGFEPSRVRAALDELVRRGLVTNDRFDPLRPGSKAIDKALAEAASAPVARRPSLGHPRPSFRRPSSTRPEGRWSRLVPVPAGEGVEDATAIAWSAALLDRYGVLTRETLALDSWAPPWRDLAPCLARAELRGEVRRGYFVEGLSGTQYASPEAADALAQRAADPRGTAAPILLSTLDPANLYGSGAPLDIDLLEGGTARLNRASGHFLVLCDGRPVLIIEAYGRRLTGLAFASEPELSAAILLLPRLARPPRRVLKVETYNGAAALASPAVPWLDAAGFVRDHPGMAYYAGWH